FVVDKPVDNEPMLLLALERPVDADVDSDATALFAEDNPVVVALDSDATFPPLALPPVHTAPPVRPLRGPIWGRPGPRARLAS
ncbi:hypothetical protein ACU7M1_17035, partial [Burkholderia pseudomallei]|uniref:hypothetical protein n=1 Tax=Burkholderia pseudomallei TaxID=28450 RepID=UPI00406C6399